MKLNWETYNIDWLIKIAEEQIPEEVEIINSLKKTTKGSWESRAYVHFVDPSNPNQPGSKWQFDTNICLTDKKNGEVVLDILKGKVVGGVEFLKFL